MSQNQQATNLDPTSTNNIILSIASPYEQEGKDVQSCIHVGAPATQNERMFFLPVYTWGGKEKCISGELHEERYDFYRVGDNEKVQSTCQRITWVKKVEPPK